LWELLFDLFLEFLSLIGLKKKRRKKKTELTLPKTNDSASKQDTFEEVAQEGVSVCAGCNRILEKDVIYELGKPWCRECYKTHVLKIKP
jgi:protein-arginine kinase activator protein McsA